MTIDSLSSPSERRIARAVFGAVKAETSGVTVGPKLKGTREFAIQIASNIKGITPDGLLDAAKKIEAYILGEDLKVTVTTE